MAADSGAQLLGGWTGRAAAGSDGADALGPGSFPRRLLFFPISRSRSPSTRSLPLCRRPRGERSSARPRLLAAARWTGRCGVRMTTSPVLPPEGGATVKLATAMVILALTAGHAAAAGTPVRLIFD